MLAPAILLVDDDASTLELVAYALKAQGYRIIEAGDGAEALQAARKYKGPIRLLLSDLAMPGVDGLELVERISPQRPEAAVLFISAYADRFDLGNYPVLAKPFTPEQLLSKIQQVLSSGKNVKHAA